MRTSINIKYDIRDKKILEEYIPTLSHLNILRGVLDGYSNGNNKSHIAYGPYGSGKSFINTIIAGVFSKTLSKEDINALCKKVKKIDKQISNKIAEAYRVNISYIPIVINGYEGDFEDVFYQKLLGELKQRNLEQLLPNYYSNVTNTIERWRKRYSFTYASFITNCVDVYGDIEHFLELIKNNDSSTIDWFNRQFELLSAGEKFMISRNSDILDILEKLNTTLAEYGYGINLIYDEFGRYLQQLRGEDINRFMQKLQDLAEYANRKEHNFSCIFITHKPIANYFIFLGEKIAGEFAKVEQRFKTYEIKSDYSAFLQISSQYINKIRKVNYLEANLLNPTLKYGLFANYFFDEVIHDLIIKGMYPLHPLTTYLLPKISAIFGQNERTLFTFINDEEQYGLKSYLEENKGLYFPDFLADYFFNTPDTEEEQSILRIYESKISSIYSLIDATQVNDTLRIFKFIFLWSAVRTDEKLKLDVDFISFSVGLEKNSVLELLGEMEQFKVIRLNLIENQYEIYEGSAFDLEAEIIRRRNKQLSPVEVIEIINQLNPYKYIYPKKYNNDKDIIRYGTIIFSNETNRFLPYEFSDIYIPIYLVKGKQYHDLYGLSNINFDAYYEDIYRYKILKSIESDKLLISNFDKLSAEVTYEIQVVQNKLFDMFKDVWLNTTFYINNESYSFSDQNELGVFLSNLFERRYSDYVEIHNDQINLFDVSSVQQRAIENVLQTVMNGESLNRYDAGRDPSSLIKRTVIDVINNNKILIHLEKELIACSGGKLSDLLLKLIAPPFGFRPSIAILIFFYSVRDFWKNIVLYKNESFIPNISSSDLVMDLIKEIKNRLPIPSEIIPYPLDFSYNPISYSFNKFENENNEYLLRAISLFEQHITVDNNKSKVIKLCSGIYNWYLDLPIVTQQGTMLSVFESKVLDIVKLMRINPTSAIEQMIDLVPSIDDLEHIKLSIDKKFTYFLDDFAEKVLKDIGITDKKSFAANLSQKELKSNRIAKIIKSGSNLIDAYKNEVDTVDLKRWTKSTFEMLRRKIIGEYEKTIGKKVAFSKITIDDEERFIPDVALSIKGKTTYDNLVNLMDATAGYLTEPEIEKIALKFFERYVK